VLVSAGTVAAAAVVVNTLIKTELEVLMLAPAYSTNPFNMLNDDEKEFCHVAITCAFVSVALGSNMYSLAVT